MMVRDLPRVLEDRTSACICVHRDGCAVVNCMIQWVLNKALWFSIKALWFVATIAMRRCCACQGHVIGHARTGQPISASGLEGFGR